MKLMNPYFENKTSTHSVNQVLVQFCLPTVGRRSSPLIPFALTDPCGKAPQGMKHVRTPFSRYEMLRDPLRYIGKGHARGKVVITMEPGSQ